MRLPQKLIESQNHTSKYLGSEDAIIRRDFEDAMIQAIDDSLLSGRLDAWRDFLGKYARFVNWDEAEYLAMRHDDQTAWIVLLQWGCTLRRLGHRYEYCFNQLLSRFGILSEQHGDQELLL